MTQTNNRFFDEMSRLMGDAASVAEGVRREAETAFRSQVERFVADMDLVRREEFDIVRDMASQARVENAALLKRVAELEKRLGIGAVADADAGAEQRQTDDAAPGAAAEATVAEETSADGESTDTDTTPGGAPI